MIKKIVSKVRRDAEREARRQLIEELFYDFSRSKSNVFGINFVRGVFFGLGVVIGGTLVVALIIWALSQVADWFPIIGDFIKRIIEAIQNAK